MSRPVDGGFTLLEILLVVTLLAMAAALVPPGIRPWEARPRSSIADSVAALAAATRVMAVESRTSATLVLDPSMARWWRFRGEALVDRGGWPTSDARLLWPDDRVTIAFSPSGDAWMPGPIRFIEDGDTTTLTIDPWTGRVRLE